MHFLLQFRGSNGVVSILGINVKLKTIARSKLLLTEGAHVDEIPIVDFNVVLHFKFFPQEFSTGVARSALFIWR